MSQKQIIILLGILLLLVAGIFVRSLNKPAEMTDAIYPTLNFSFDPAAVSKVTLSRFKEGKQDSQVSLEKSDKGWIIPSLWNARVNEEKLETFLTKIREAKGELRASNVSLLPDFGIQDAETYQIKLFTPDGQALNLLLGTKASGPQGVFMRYPDSPAVYFVSTDFFGDLGIYENPANASLNPMGWTDKRLMARGLSDMRSMKLISGEGPAKFHLEKDENGNWKSVGEPASEMDQEKIGRFISLLVSWQATDILDPARASEFGFDHPGWVMTLEIKDAELLTITAGKFNEKDKVYPVQVSGETVLYEVSQYSFDERNKSQSDFAAEVVASSEAPATSQ